MSSKGPNSFVFAIIMCILTSVILTFTADGLKERQLLNKKIDKQKNILKALELIKEDVKYQGEQITQIYKKSVKNYFVNPKTGELLTSQAEDSEPIYIVMNQDKIEKYAVPFKAFGLWSYIYGIIAFKGDGETSIGFTVFQHGETPGLGAEVEQPWFQHQFRGKKIVDQKGQFVSIGVVKGKVQDKIPVQEQDNYVDGISGATLTGDGVQRDLKTVLGTYEIFAKKLREG